ncbi:MAG: site-specific integrase, partial [Deltaproteobacteria bacterium]
FIVLEETKNNERREVPINETLQNALEGLKKPGEYVFCDKEGQPYKDIKRSFHTALRKARIEDFRFHDLRHTFASQLVMAGENLATVKELLGHKSIEMTLKYAHLSPDQKIKAVRVIDGVLTGKMDTYMDTKQEGEGRVIPLNP